MSRSRILRFALPELHHFLTALPGLGWKYLVIPELVSRENSPRVYMSGRLIFTSPYLNSAPSPRVLELARQGAIPAHPLGDGQQKVWRFRLSEIAAAMGSRAVNHVRRSPAPKEI
jgi:hypothetical protein